MHGKYVSILVVLSFLLGFAPIFVQPTAAQDDVCTGGVCQGTMDAGGVTHTIAYPDSMAEDAVYAKRAVQDAIGVFQPWFGNHPTIFGSTTDTETVPFRVFLGLTPTTEAGWDAESFLIEGSHSDGYGAVNVGQHECEINLNFVNNPELWGIIVAHEVGHCYLYIYSQITRTTAANEWWGEGAAEWLATQVYPDIAGTYIAQSTQGAFRDLYEIPLFDRGYDAFYFWEVMRASEGSEVVVNHLVHLPSANTPNEFATYLRNNEKDLAGLFNQFARRIYGDKVHYQPPRSSLKIPKQAVNGFPTEISLQAAWFSISYEQLTLPVVPEDQAVRLVVTNAGPSQVRVVMMNGEKTKELLDGEPVDFCGSESAIDLAISRVGEDEGTASFTLNLTTVDRNETDCPRDLPDCMVGRWYLRTIPAAPINDSNVSTHFEFAPENYFFDFYKDARFEATLISVTGISNIGDSDSMPALPPGGALVIESDSTAATVITSLNAHIGGFFVVASYGPSDTEFRVESTYAKMLSSAITVQMGDQILSVGSIAASDILPDVYSFTCRAEGSELVMMTNNSPDWVLYKTPQ